MKFKLILCGVDFSEASVSAFETAVELARLMNSQLHILHVIEADPAVLDLTLETKAMAAMNALVAPVTKRNADIRLTTEVITGSAFAELVDRAHQSETDLIVIGSRGIPLLEETFIGRTAERVMKEAECSVLVVKS